MNNRIGVDKEGKMDTFFDYQIVCMGLVTSGELKSKEGPSTYVVEL